MRILSDESIGKSTDQCTKRNEKLKGKRNNHGTGELYIKYRLEKSFFGYDPSVLKSGIQKYARRAEVTKGLWCLVEMDLLFIWAILFLALNGMIGNYTSKNKKLGIHQ